MGYYLLKRNTRHCFCFRCSAKMFFCLHFILSSSHVTQVSNQLSHNGGIHDVASNLEQAFRGPEAATTTGRSSSTQSPTDGHSPSSQSSSSSTLNGNNTEASSHSNSSQQRLKIFMNIFASYI